MSSRCFVKDLFLRSMAAIYMFAFGSLYLQIPGLYGNNGLLPAANLLKRDFKVSVLESIRRKPTLLWFAHDLGLSADGGMSLLCIIGVSFGLLATASKAWRGFTSFLVLWLLYFSLYQVGQTFLWFQWDILLLETGFLCILLSSPSHKLSGDNNGCPSDSISLWLVKWLLFRLMFASGVVKLTSGCPTWWGLTALDWHYESQCIPTPLAWFANHLPQWFQRFSVVMTFVIEIPIPFLFFSPIKSLRFFAFCLQVLFQLMIIATGNYNFFNLLTIALCISLLDDVGLSFIDMYDVSSSFCEGPGAVMEKHRVLRTMKDWVKKLLVFFVIFVLLYWTKRLFVVEFDSENIVTTKVGFTQAEFEYALKTVVPFSIWLGAASLGLVVVQSLVSSILERKSMISFVYCLVKAAIAVWLFSISLVPYTTIDADTRRSVWPVVQKWYSQVDEYQLVNSYGLFRRMTGVGGRPEIVIEGSNSLDGPWKEYNFKYKPGVLTEMPPFIVPHQPRLDWQMWFAALGSHQHNPWFVHLAYRLLNGDRDVLDLMAKNQPFVKPPLYIRALLYKYHYTKVACKSLGDFLEKSRSIKSYWTREFSTEYLPPLSKSEPTLLQFLHHFDLGPKTKVDVAEPRTGYLHYLLLLVRSRLRLVDPGIFLATLFLIGFFSNRL